jgi:hypothetical protein
MSFGKIDGWSVNGRRIHPEALGQHLVNNSESGIQQKQQANSQAKPHFAE